MKYEVEDGTGPNGRDLRFGFDPLEFPEFSWRGYVPMTSVQVYSQRATAHCWTPIYMQSTLGSKSPAAARAYSRIHFL